jgi:hypothetical protein
MPSNKLLDYITQARQSGKTDDQIRQELLSNGWQNNDIEESLKPIAQAITGRSFKLPILISLIFLFAVGGYFASAYFLALWPFELKTDISITPTQNPTPATKKYSPDDLGFLITTPADWKYESVDSNEINLVAVFQYKSSDSQKSFFITVIGNVDPEKTTLNAWAKSDALKYDSQAKENLANKLGNYLWTSYNGETTGKIYKKSISNPRNT